MRRAYREVFSSPQGRAVLYHILETCYVFDPAPDAESLVLQRLGVAILENLGMYDDRNGRLIIDKLFELPARSEGAETHE
jgi:hypothetical protein